VDAVLHRPDEFIRRTRCTSHTSFARKSSRFWTRRRLPKTEQRKDLLILPLDEEIERDDAVFAHAEQERAVRFRTAAVELTNGGKESVQALFIGRVEWLTARPEMEAPACDAEEACELIPRQATYTTKLHDRCARRLGLLRSHSAVGLFL
jgi:hypothetical protein